MPRTLTDSGRRANPDRHRQSCRFYAIATAIVVLTICPATRADEPVVDPELLATQTRQWRESIRDLTTRLDAQPDNLRLVSYRGDAHFFLGDFEAAVRDYDRMVTLDPKVDASHWRRGIAYFMVGKYDAAAKQFERYHSHDDVDRENGIWRYLSQVKAIGREKARAGLLKYAKDDREPFPAVYELFAGRTTPDAILSRIDAAKIGDGDRQARLFYAELYIGLNEFIENREESALAHLATATRNPWPRSAGYGPNYMWHVGRLQHDRIKAELERRSASGKQKGDS